MIGTPPRILACGEVLWDMFPQGPRFGGAPANFACHAALLGARVSIFSAVGNYTRGSQALGILKRFGLDTSLIKTIPNATTGTVGVSVDPAGKPTFKIHADSAWDQLAWAAENAHLIEEFDAVYFGTLAQRSEPSRTAIRNVLLAAKARGIPRVLDINLRSPFYDDALLRDSIALASVVKLSDEEFPEVAAACAIPMADSHEATLEALRSSFSLDYIAMTRGANGALLISRAGAADQRGIPTTVVDTVGAGDAFTAALALGLLRGRPDFEIVEFACETGSAACRHAGGVPEHGGGASPSH